MRVVPCMIVAASVCLTLAGCSHTNRRPAGGEAPFTGANPQAATRAADPPDPLFKSAAAAPTLDGLLAGRVLDRVNGQPLDANIRWVCVDDPKEKEEPIDVATDRKGYFIIQGLKAGKHYKLVAKSKQGDRVLEGVAYTTAPNPNVWIKMTDEPVRAAGDPPAPAPVPPAPAAPERKPPEAKKSAAVAPERPASAQVPVWEPTVGSVPVPSPNQGRPGLGIGGPAETPAVNVNPAWDRPGDVPAPDRTKIAEQDRPKIPLIKINPSAPPPPAVGSPVPSCVLLGKQLRDFALYDVNGRPWEYRAQKRGKLTLIDFWSTGCLPCIQALPHLRMLKDRYGSMGLDVVGIAAEGGGTYQEKAQRVLSAAQRQQINYPLLLASGKQCPVLTQFGVSLLPTVVLVEEHGWIVWRHEGRLERHHLDELERYIKVRLGVN